MQLNEFFFKPRNYEISGESDFTITEWKNQHKLIEK